MGTNRMVYSVDREQYAVEKGSSGSACREVRTVIPSKIWETPKPGELIGHVCKFGSTVTAELASGGVVSQVPRGTIAGGVVALVRASKALDP